MKPREGGARILALRESLALLRTPRFGTFWFASLFSNVGTWAQQVAQPWLLLSLGASSLLLGLDAFAMSAPVWVLTLPGGVLADRADRRRVIAAFQSVQMLCPTLIIVLLLTHSIGPWIIIATSLVVGITDALSMPSFSSIVPSIVERPQIAAGLALNSTQFNISRIAGPALAGVLMGTVGAIGCFIASAASYIPFIGVALWILPRPASTVSKPRVSTRHVFAGAAAIARDPTAGGALLTALGSGFFCGPLITFCPVLIRSAFHGDIGFFSATVGAFGIGGLLGGIGLLGVEPSRDRRRLSSWFAAGFGFLVVLAALDPWLVALPGVLALAGIAMSVTNTSTNTILQSDAPASLRGQAVSLFMLASRGGMALGCLVTGMLVGWLGIRAALLVNGVLALCAQAAIGHSWLRSRTA